MRLTVLFSLLAPAIAHAAEITASSVQPGNEAAKAFDASLDSRWCADGPSFPQWLQIDLGEVREFAGVKIVWESGNNAYRHTLEGSADGTTWQPLCDASKNETGGDTVCSFNAAKCRYLKITCTGASQGGWASIREVALLTADEVRLATVESPEALKKSGNITPRIEPISAEREAEILKDVQVADGFEATLFAAPPSANYPVFIAASPQGDVYVSSDGNGSLDRSQNRGRILRLRDADHDGHADQVTEFVKHVDAPRGLVWDQDRLYVVHPPDVSCYIDADGDGVAEQEKVLIKGIAFAYPDRPADHTTNGLTMGIDGWLYIAGGDFGFMDAVGTDGKHLQHRGGGVIRFKPDGSHLELFSDGTRNILEVAISPLMEIFARDNTNDGGGWDVRFHHFTGLEDHGYPRLFKNFGDEIIKPLADYGGGSGCGTTWLSEPGIPEKWNNAPLTCDWGTGALWKHTVKPKGATFEEVSKPEPLIKMTRPTDAAVDGMSRIYQASWKGATFGWEGSNVGYIVMVKPKGYTPEPLPEFAKLSAPELVKLLESPSQVRAMAAQRALRRIPGLAGTEVWASLLELAADRAKPLPARVAATHVLISHLRETAEIGRLAADDALRPFVVRALGDAGSNVISKALICDNSRSRLEALVAIARDSKSPSKITLNQIIELLNDPDPVITHTAFQTLARIKAADACFAALDDKESSQAVRTGVLRALMRMHETNVVSGLIDRFNKEGDAAKRFELFSALCRLHFHEGEWKGDSWGTRPDTRGPYYQPEPWSETQRIAAVLKDALAKADATETPKLMSEMRRNRIESTEALQRLMEMAKGKPAMLPDLIKQLSEIENLPKESEPFLLGAVRGNSSSETLAQAIVVLSKFDSREAMIAAMEGLEKLSDDRDQRKEREAAATAFLTAPKLENWHALFEERAAAMAASDARWADTALITLAARKDGSPEARDQSAKALAEGWNNPKRRVQILNAVRITRSHAFDDKVLAAMDDADAAVATEAKKTAAALKLEPPKEDKTPLVSSMEPAKVIEEMEKTHGDKALGEQLFQKQICSTCHATSLDQVQKGPYLGNIAQTYKRGELAANILDPGRTIAQGFTTETVALKDGTSQTVFITLEGAEEVKARTIGGQEFTWKVQDIASRTKLPVSMMPPGLVSNLTLRQFASLLDYLEALSKK